MGLNFKEALAAVSRALPLVLLRAGIFVTGGFAVIILFGMLLFVFRRAGSTEAVLASLAAVLVAWGITRALQRFVFYRHQAAMLFLFSGRCAAAPGLSGAIREIRRSFPSYSSWRALNRSVHRFLAHAHRRSSEFTIPPAAHEGTADLMAAGPISQAVLALAFSRGGPDITLSAREGLVLLLRHGNETRSLARRWLWFSAAGMVLLFFCLALPNWFFFQSAGAPVGIGIVLAVTIAWLLHQAFVQPFILAGVSAALLAETRGRDPDPTLYEKIEPLLTT